MWYLSGTGWSPGGAARPRAAYNLRHALSDDGQRWRPQAATAIDFSHPGEMAIARPSVLRAKGLFRMWYCYRGSRHGYRIGYAVSPDGAGWRRMDDTVGLAASDSGWDSQMCAYPHVFEHADTRYMLYCGNGFSAEGFGLAGWQS